MTMIKRTFGMAIAVLMIAFGGNCIKAEELRMGIALETSSMDPHFFDFTPNNAISRDIFDRLIHQGPRQELKPGLAVSWRLVDDKTWEFELRRDVNWHDGSPFTADDVVFTMERAPNVPNSPGGYGLHLSGMKGVKIDDYTVHIKTDKPHPLVPAEMSAVPIISLKYGKGATTQDYNSGKATIGTGPYKFVEWVPGNRIVLVANPDYWGPKPKFDRVIQRPIKSPQSRIAALLKGDVDLIDAVPTIDIKRLKQNPNIVISQSVSYRCIYLHLDSNRDISPYVKTLDGKPVWPNPLRDWRVRKAMTKAINRKAIVERIMDNVAEPASQLGVPGYFGASPHLKPEPYDPEGAKELLAQAGYADGFRLTLHSPNDRYANDEKIAQAVAQMLTRVGIRTAVETMPRNVFFPTVAKLKFSFYLAGFGPNTGEVSSSLKALVHSYNRDQGNGMSNRGRYSNVRFDMALDQARATLDDIKRRGLLEQASEIVTNDVGVIPLHYEMNTWATRKGLRYEARTDELTLTESVIKEN